MFRLPESERKKLDELRKVIDPLDKVRHLMKDKSFIYNLYLSVATCKYGTDKIDFEKIVSDPKSYLSPGEKDRIIKMISVKGTEKAFELLSLPFKFENGKWIPNSWEIDQEYLSIKKRLWYKFHSK